MYQLRRFTRRHKALVGSVVAIFLILSLAVVGMGWALYKAKLDLERRAIMQVYVGLMQQAVYEAVEEGKDPAFFVELLDRASERIEEAIRMRPETEAEIRLNISDLYRSSRAWDQTLFQAQRSYELYLEEAGSEDQMTLWAEISIADSLRGLGRHEEALPHFLHCLSSYRAHLGWFDPDLPVALRGSVELLREADRVEEAAREARATLDALVKMRDSRAWSERATARLGEWIELAEGLLAESSRPIP